MYLMAHRVNNYSKVKTSRRIILHKNKLFLVSCYFRAACVSFKSALSLYYVYVTYLEILSVKNKLFY